MQHKPYVNARTAKSFVDRVVRVLERRAAASVVVGEMGSVTDRNMQLVLAFGDIEPKISDETATLYRAALTCAIGQTPGSDDFNALSLLHPEPGPTESDRLEQLAERRARNLPGIVGTGPLAQNISMEDWISLFNSLQGALLDIECLLMRTTPEHFS
jgi:hypothetical protein